VENMNEEIKKLTEEIREKSNEKGQGDKRGEIREKKKN
jgi:hypothetical protein